jgi:hypothetical protein
MAGIPVITDPTNYLEIARQTADALNGVIGEQFKAAQEEGYEVSELDLGTLAQIAQVNYLAAIAEGLKKLGG